MDIAVRNPFRLGVVRMRHPGVVGGGTRRRLGLRARRSVGIRTDTWSSHRRRRDDRRSGPIGRRHGACCVRRCRRLHLLMWVRVLRGRDAMDEQQCQADRLRQRGARGGAHASTRTSRIMPPSMWYSRWQW